MKMTDSNNTLAQHGLDWKVNKERMFLEDGTPTNHFAVVREDTREVLASVGKNYTLFQNSDMLALVRNVAEFTDAPVHKAGYFSNGKKVFIQLASPVKLDGIGINNDTVRFYSTCLNSHDGTTPVSWGSSSVTISCMNTFNASMKSLKKQGMSVRHSAGTINPLLEQIMYYKQAFDESVDASYGIADKMYFMSKAEVTSRQVTAFIDSVFDVDFSSTNLDSINRKKFNRAVELREAVMSEMAQKGHTAWGMFNGVTKFTTHLSNKNQDVRDSSKMVGPNIILDNSAFNLAYKMATSVKSPVKHYSSVM
jgi:phage/plasmid-like protein (TIGR03299 family)